MNRFIYILLLILSLVSCFNYSFTGGGLPGINSIAIPIADDKTNEFQLREKVTNSLIDKFMQDGNLKIENINASDSILRCTIQSISDRSATIDRNEVASQFELNISVSLVLEDRKTGKTIIKKSVRGQSNYTDLSERNQAIEEAIDKLTTDILEEIISAW
ncbi:LptE family protein [candidate division KSB1 bacterium]